ncbi:MAG: glycosyltransferase family 4 protein [Candidatus Saccharibacteria bacterium]
MLGWELPPHNSGGLGVACYNMSKALALDGAVIDFVVPYQAEHTEINFMTVHGAVNLSPLQRFNLGAYDIYTSKDISGLDSMRAVQQRYTKFVEKLIKITKPDIIHCHDWLTMEAGMRAKELTGVPLVAHIHATEFDRSGNHRGNQLVHEIEYNGLMMADRVIAVSGITKNIIIDKYKIPADKIEVVHNAIDVSELNDGYVYNDRTYRYLEALKSEGYTVVSTITRFTIQKGLFHFIRAAARACEKYNKLVFLLAGDGEQRDELIKLAADLGIADRVFFTGFVRGKQWRDAYSVSDIFVMSSVSEPFGLTALEAAHHGNALIITKQSGVGEVLNNIFRYDFWQEDVLANQIIGIATSDALRTSLQNNVKKEYTKLSWDDVASSCSRIYGLAQKGIVV